MDVFKSFSPEYAEWINGVVKKEIGENLWLVCNFDFTPKTKNIEASFMKKINEMYIFTHDVGLYKKLAHNLTQDKKEIARNILRNISRRRNVFDHNTSDDNGTLGDKEWYLDWINTVIGCSDIETDEQWTKLYDCLCSEEAQLIKIYEDFIFECGKTNNEDKSELAKIWRNYILHWYRNASGRQAVLRQWGKLYCANHPNDIIDNMHLKLNDYVKKLVMASLYEQKEALKIVESKIGKDIPNVIAERYGDIENRKNKIKNAILTELQNHKGKHVDIDDYKLYADWYIDRVMQMVSEYSSKGLPSEVDSWLPQDLIQYICTYREKEITSLNIAENTNVTELSTSNDLFVSDVISEKEKFQIGTRVTITQLRKAKNSAIEGSITVDSIGMEANVAGIYIGDVDAIIAQGAIDAYIVEPLQFQPNKYRCIPAKIDGYIFDIPKSEVPFLQFGTEVSFVPINVSSQRTSYKGYVNGVTASLGVRFLSRQQKHCLEHAIKTQNAIQAKVIATNNQGNGYELYIE